MHMDINFAIFIDYNEFQNEILYGLQNGKKYCFLIGSGASVSSKIPMGRDMVKEWFDELIKLSKEENETRYYDALKKNRLAAMAKVIDRCNNVSTMAGSFDDKKIANYIDETETYVYPVLTSIKQTWPKYNNPVYLIKYQMLSVLESLKIMLSEK